MTTDKEILEELGLDKQKEDDVDKYESMCKLPFLTGNQLMDLPSIPNDFIIENFLWKRQSVMIIAKDKVGKSILTVNMALNLTCGESFLNSYSIPKKCNVVYIQTEGSREGTKENIQKMTTGNNKMSWNPDRFCHIYRSGLQLHTEAGGAEIINTIRLWGVKPDVIFIDPQYKAMSGGDMNSSKDVTIVTDNYDKMKEEFNCALMVVQHKRKTSKTQNGQEIDMGDEEAMGSSIFKNYFDHTINMRRLKCETRKLNCDTQRNGNVVKELSLILGQPDSGDALRFLEKDVKSNSGSEDAVLAYIKNKPSCRKEISMGGGIKDGTVGNAITSLKKKGLIKVHSKVSNRVVYEVS